ncbi:FtsX-like permease family protein [Phytohabitans rumicis]|uniref:ABC3 transporter permease C-terminal domain-containing protein n=1 Tax=Phytohabitans rumicis TaxID=1076125 RepID=A0A6V8L5B8_9ACTN|nr:FtsX-like permease family protein [Phytohabitans rumicis]GFJ89277.1 hypothetical protein Prum_029190 [Phytohabitans rumicis]
MLRVVLGAIRSRRAQAATLFLLTALAVLAATAAPAYVVSAARSVALADVASAPAVQRIVLVTGRVAPEPDALSTVRAEAGRIASVPGASGIASIRVVGRVIGAGPDAPVILGTRDEMCAHVALDGDCPDSAGEVLISRRMAARLRLEVGDPVRFEIPGKAAIQLRVAGLYELIDPLGPYWQGSVLGRVSGTDAATGAGDVLLANTETLVSTAAAELFAEYHLVVPPRAYLGIDGYDLAAEVDRQQDRAAGVWRVESRVATLTERVEREQRLVNLGVGVAAVELLVLCWFALFFAVRHSAEQRRPDIGLLKLRGGAWWRVWALVFQQSVLPMLAGAVVGAAGGLGLARLLGDVDPDRAALATALSLAAGGAAVLGALVAALAADWRGLGAGVIDLLRHVPARRRGWRADAIDLVVVVVAVAGVYQAYASDTEPGEASGLVLVAPALIALAVGLVAARAIAPLAVRVGHRALRAGRLPLAMAATHLARRPGTHRVFALLAVAVALLATAVSGWSVGAGARAERAAHEVGADRVLTVQARSRAHLLAAVRAADPGGTHAAAVVRNGAGVVVLAVDSERFARVVSWQQGYGDGPANLAERLRPAAPPPVRVADGRLTLDVATQGPAPPLVLVTHLVTGGGEALTVQFGPLAVGRKAYSMELMGCGGESGCRLVGLELARPTANGEVDEPPSGTAVVVYGLAGPAGPVLDVADATRWRGLVRQDALGPAISVRDGGLRIAAPPDVATTGIVRSGMAYVVDTPVPLPVLYAGLRQADGAPGDPRLALFGGDELPVRFVGGAAALPKAGGRAYLVDLEYADRVAPPAGLGDEAQVWLGPDAPDDLVDRLREQGLGVLATDSIAAAQDRFGQQGPPLALRFQVFAGVIGVLLAAGALAVAAAVERPDRSAELAALRAQGLPLRAVHWIGYGGYGALAAAGVLVGVVAAALGGALVEAPIPVFVDDWRVLPVPTGPQAVPLVLAGLGALVVVGVTGMVAAAQLVRASRSGGGRP